MRNEASKEKQREREREREKDKYINLCESLFSHSRPCMSFTSLVRSFALAATLTLLHPPMYHYLGERESLRSPSFCSHFGCREPDWSPPMRAHSGDQGAMREDSSR